MIELEVHNFQSVRSATMTVKGFAAIVGRSNIGKSAIVRAAQYALTGALGTNFVRHSSDCDRVVRSTKKCKCFSKVLIRTEKMEVTWEKGDNVNRYTVLRSGSDKPEVFEGLERGTPEFLLPDFQLVKVGDRKELIQIPNQFEPIFLLNQSGPAVADVLSDVARLDRINQAMGLVTKDRKEVVSRRKVRDGDITALEQELSRFDGLDDVAVDAVVKALQELKTKQRVLQSLDGFIERLGGLKVSLLGLTEALKPELPVFASLEEQAEFLVNASRLCSESIDLQTAIEELEGVHVHKLPDLDILEKNLESLNQVQEFLEGIAEKVPVLRQLMQIGSIDVPDEKPLQKAFGELESAIDLQRRWEVVGDVGVLEQAAGQRVPDLEPVHGTFDRYRQVLEFVGRDELFTASLQRLLGDLNEATKAEEDLLSEMETLGMCPTCDQPLGSNHKLHLESA